MRSSQHTDNRETIVIIGGGFAGINLAKRLSRKKFRIVLIDRNNFHSFPPLFYQIASSGLGASNICFPLRREFFKLKNASYRMGHVKYIDILAKTVTTDYETITYDRLVIAAGTKSNFFNIKDLDKKVYGIKTVAEAMLTRDEILDRLERAAVESDPEEKRALLRFLVVGGGPSGVEIAGALGEMKKYIVPREYPELDPSEVDITLIEGSDKLLASLGEKSSQKAREYLQSLLVNVRTGERLNDYTDKIASFADGHKERWETVIWTAGVTGESMPGIPEEFIGRGGRIKVDRFNRVGGRDDLFALGDIACCESEQYPAGLPQLAQPAIQGAKCLAQNLNHGVFSRKFCYKDMGTMATVGRNRAVAKIGKFFFSGFLAWVVWMWIHLISLLGMRNRINVLLNWIWNYLTYSTTLRLLLRPKQFPQRNTWAD